LTATVEWFITKLEGAAAGQQKAAEIIPPLVRSNGSP
jgi:hypothetical protein